MVYYETDYVTIEHNPELKAAAIIWKDSEFTTEQYRETILKSQNLIEEHDIDNLLADLRQEKKINEKNHIWVRRTVLPQLEMLGLKRFAFLYNGNVYSQMHAEGLTETIITMNFEVKHFSEIDDAHKWFAFYTD